ncbi:MAG: hybrid sensor histidine kinase/response regulator [Gemmatimonadales bacterium]|nr:MAG: hybrid sensor histidine kinase/response regulator [Gemmatimonadales bacterium]
MISREDILALAPTPLPNRRPDRYIGADGGIALSELHPADRAALGPLYEALKSLYGQWLRDRPGIDGEALARRVRAFGALPLSRLAESLGDPTREFDDLRWSVRRAIHDLRGGGLFALRLYGGLPEADLAGDPETLLAAAFLARDQAKIIRNILPELDPVGRAADEAEKVHAFGDVLEKWDGFRVPGASSGAVVRVRSEYGGPLASCCLEASTVDRILYNLINNALRFSAGDSVELQVVEIPGGALRWVVSNRLSDDQRDWLDREVGEGRGIFRPGVTRGGEGTGLASCAEFVSSAFGLGGADGALRDGYLGAGWGGERFDAWFHWPLYAPEASAEGSRAVTAGRER